MRTSRSSCPRTAWSMPPERNDADNFSSISGIGSFYGEKRTMDAVLIILSMLGFVAL